jgi:hypothetical protein
MTAINTGFGLYQSQSGNKFLITRDFDVWIAITLYHPDLPAFTWLPFTERPGEKGRWLGPCEIRLTHMLPKGSQSSPGHIGILEHYLSMDCCSVDGQRHSIALGSIGDVKYHGRKFDGWALDVLGSFDCFFGVTPRANSGSRPLPRAPAGMVEPFELRQSV